MFAFLKSKAVVALTLVLAAQSLFYLTTSNAEVIPETKPLSGFPAEFPNWKLVADTPVEPEVQKVLRADDTLNRVYGSTGRPRIVSLFIAFFKSQRTGVAPHSPKNCLPGAGWAPLTSGFATIDVPGRGEPIEVNRYVVGRAEQKTLVMYWYQSRDRVIASEYTAKIYLVLDALRYRRSDTAIVRIVVPIPEGGSEEEAEQVAERFVQTAFAAIVNQLPA